MWSLDLLPKLPSISIRENCCRVGQKELIKAMISNLSFFLANGHIQERVRRWAVLVLAQARMPKFAVHVCSGVVHIRVKDLADTVVVDNKLNRLCALATLYAGLGAANSGSV